LHWKKIILKDKITNNQQWIKCKWIAYLPKVSYHKRNGSFKKSSTSTTFKTSKNNCNNVETTNFPSAKTINRATKSKSLVRIKTFKPRPSQIPYSKPLAYSTPNRGKESPKSKPQKDTTSSRHRSTKQTQATPRINTISTTRRAGLSPKTPKSFISEDDLLDKAKHVLMKFSFGEFMKKTRKLT